MKNKQDELASLNDQLFDEFHLQELEQRLETDPFLVGGLFDSVSAADCFNCGIGFKCEDFTAE